MPLVGYKSLCEEYQAMIVSKDDRQKRKHRAINKEKNKVSHYKIDGNVVKAGLRCDFLLMNDDKKDAFLIELKGNHIEHAIDQLVSTATALKSELNDYTVKYRIVFSRARTHAIRSAKFEKFKNAHREKGEFCYGENVLEEVL